jgi:hypothetical protein
MEAAIQELRYAARRLARTPAFAVIALGTLSLAIGASTAAFADRVRRRCELIVSRLSARTSSATRTDDIFRHVASEGTAPTSVFADKCGLLQIVR